MKRLLYIPIFLGIISINSMEMGDWDTKPTREVNCLTSTAQDFNQYVYSLRFKTYLAILNDYTALINPSVPFTKELALQLNTIAAVLKSNYPIYDILKSENLDNALKLDLLNYVFEDNQDILFDMLATNRENKNLQIPLILVLLNGDCDIQKMLFKFLPKNLQNIKNSSKEIIIKINNLISLITPELQHLLDYYSLVTLGYAEVLKDHAAINYFISLGYDPKQAERTLWFEAARDDNPAILQSLNNNGFVLETVNGSNLNALDLAISHLNPQSVELLLSLGMNPNKISVNGNLPLTLLFLSFPVKIKKATTPEELDQFFNKLYKTITIMLIKGANPNLKDAHGKTAFNYAEEELGKIDRKQTEKILRLLNIYCPINAAN